VSDNGAQVTIGIHLGNVQYTDTRLELWDARTGANQTPPLWRSEKWSSIFAGSGIGYQSRLKLLTHAGGRELLRDEAAWAALRKRFDTRSEGKEEDRKLSQILPRDGSFSPDGRYFAYEVQIRLPILGCEVMIGEGTRIEDVRTGKFVAFLPRSTPPDRRTAVARQISKEREGGLPWPWPADVKSSSRPDERVFFEDDGIADFGADGRFAFAHYTIWGQSSTHYLKWWDTTTSKPVGLVVNAPDHALIDNDRALVTHPWHDIKNGGIREPYRLHFWDTATGASLGEWDLGARSDKGGLINDLVGSESGRYLAGEYSPDTGVGRSPAVRIGDRLARAVGDEPPDWRRQILLWDVIERCELARLPGRSAAFSRDGSWLATIDDRGILRVWEVPPRRPWGHILGYAAVASLGCLALLLVIARMGRRVWGTGAGRRLRRGVARLWGGRVRRWWTAGFVGLFVLVLGGVVWYSMAVTAAREQMEAAYEQIGGDVTEADVTALVGQPPDDGPVEPGWPAGGMRGGGQGGIPVTAKKWTRLGTEMVVHFGEDGTAKASFISDPPRGLLERAVDWLGW
jgi:hypothetical protein